MRTDFVEHLFTATTHDYLMFFTHTGRVMSSACMKFPTWAARPRAAASPICSNCAEEKIAATIRIQAKTDEEDVTWEQPGFIFFATRRASSRKPNLKDFKNIRKGGIIAIKIEEGDALID